MLTNTCNKFMLNCNIFFVNICYTIYDSHFNFRYSVICFEKNRIDFCIKHLKHWFHDFPSRQYCVWSCWYSAYSSYNRGRFGIIEMEANSKIKPWHFTKAYGKNYSLNGLMLIVFYVFSVSFNITFLSF